MNYNILGLIGWLLSVALMLVFHRWTELVAFVVATYFTACMAYQEDSKK